jgi:RNA polymerase sigma-70 factor (ECF subfamily)
MKDSHAGMTKTGEQMSATVISFGVDVRIPQSGSSQLNDSAPWVHVLTPDAPAMQESGEMHDPGLCYDAACQVDLVSAAKAGDERAFVELCRRYTPSLKRRIRKIVRNREDAEDVLQDTLISAFRHLAGFRARCSFQTWMISIATNNALMLLRKRRNHPETGLRPITTDGKELEIFEPSDPLPNPEEVYAKQQSTHRLAAAVRMLHPSFRILMERYHQDEVRLVDAANALGITVAAAKSRLMRARHKLRRTLERS